jgi:hypothetical protein
MKKTQGEIANPLDILKYNGYKPDTDLNYCTDNGVEYYIGWKDKAALIVAIMYDESIYMISKEELREMSLSARHYGIEKVTLLTNYGMELHSRLEKPETVGLNKIIKAVSHENRR